MLRENLMKLAAFLVAVVLVILGLTVNVGTIRNWISGTSIVVSSATRGRVDEYLAGEILRLSLENVRTPRVVWLFDDGQPVVGAVEAQYAFPFQENVPAGQARDRRIDAFFKSGDSYKTATTLVRTRNIKYTATANVKESHIVLTAPTEFGSDWFLNSVSLATFGDGRFSAHGPLPAKSTGQLGEFIATPKDTGAAFACTDLRSCDAVLRDNRGWASFDFINKTTGAKLTIAKRLEVTAKK